MQQTRGKHSMFWWCASTKQGKRAIKNARVCAIWIIYALESATRFDRVGVLSSQAAQRRETERFVRSLADDEGFCLLPDPERDRLISPRPQISYAPKALDRSLAAYLRCDLKANVFCLPLRLSRVLWKQLRTYAVFIALIFHKAHILATL